MSSESSSRVVSATEFRSRCPEFVNDVQRTGTAIVVTKDGKPVARLVPYDEAPPALFGMLSGTVQASDDLTAPTGEIWEADA